MSNDHFLPHEPIRFDKHHLDQLLVLCYQREASDITLQTNEPVFAEIHGRLVRVTQRRLSANELSEIINIMYGPNGTTQLLSGTDVDTHYEIKPARHERYRFRINGTACMVDGFDGIQVTARSIPNEPPDIETLELDKTLLASLEPDQGVIYVTGATGSGKSTLLASIIKHIVKKPDSNRKVLTYESPIEFVYDDIEMPSAIVSQSEIPRHLPSFAAGVRNALRRKPQLILVGEARDAETINAVMEAAMTGHPVYTTLHSNGVAETVRRLVNTYPQEERHGKSVDLFETIRVVVWQKLIPSLDGRRVALREYLVFNEEVRDRLLAEEPDNATAVTRRLLKELGQTMEVDANKKYEQGLISERDHRILVASSRKADQDAGIT
ncbi:MAG: Dot/Icm secretion system ATPase DotB [Gammaproteobacteria bacterium CG11_big_fil_rev_8_21_14_0_20_46_22]|nr:MAG: Dot/Icm secretion system ATPase DotB [Gammaproteobacteria bacterium CG12_big_fil_rev_8_21_14_0_65_46_12]PIR10557.1 MAG: Dot/Icm secretion system ATPase DotB [Gammaproteobacteria bacterium CG11_big_fil_rev_8_21_14_0_20_46_22]